MAIKTERPGRELLMDVARDAFLKHGYANVSMQQLAEAAGMTKGAPYYHFKNKDDLFLSIFLREIERIRDGLIERLEEGGTLRKRLKQCVLYMIETTQGDFNQLFTDFERHFKNDPGCIPITDERVDLSLALLPYFAAAREHGDFARLTPERACEFFLMLVFGQMKFMQFEETRPELHRPAVDRANDLVDLLFDGL